MQLTNQVNRVIARPMNVVRMQFTGVAYVKTLALAILLGFIQTQTPQGRSRTPSTPIWCADSSEIVTMETKDTFPQDRQDSHCPVSRTWALVIRALFGVGKTISSEKQETRLQEVH